MKYKKVTIKEKKKWYEYPLTALFDKDCIRIRQLDGEVQNKIILSQLNALAFGMNGGWGIDIHVPKKEVGEALALFKVYTENVEKYKKAAVLLGWEIQHEDESNFTMEKPNENIKIGVYNYCGTIETISAYELDYTSTDLSTEYIKAFGSDLFKYTYAIPLIED